MLSKVRDLLDDLSDAEKTALMSGQYTTPALKEVRTLVQTWQASVASGLLEELHSKCAALAVSEATYQAKTRKSQNRAKWQDVIQQSKEKRLLSGGVLLDSILRGFEDTRLRVEQTKIRDGLSKAKLINKSFNGSRAKKAITKMVYLIRVEIRFLWYVLLEVMCPMSLSETYTAIGVEYVKFIATLDSRTSKICMGYSDKVYKKDEPHPVPPLHPNCRSILILSLMIQARPLVCVHSTIK